MRNSIKIFQLSSLDPLWKLLSHVWLFVTPWTLCSLWNSPGQNTGVGSCSLLQGIFPIQGLNTGHPHCRHILYQLSHQGIPRLLEWVAYPFSSGSSWPRNRTGVSCIAGGFFTSWATREASQFLCNHNISCVFSDDSVRKILQWLHSYYTITKRVIHPEKILELIFSSPAAIIYMIKCVKL